MCPPESVCQDRIGRRMNVNGKSGQPWEINSTLSEDRFVHWKSERKLYDFKWTKNWTRMESNSLRVLFLLTFLSHSLQDSFSLEDKCVLGSTIVNGIVLFKIYLSLCKIFVRRRGGGLITSPNFTHDIVCHKQHKSFNLI